MSDWSHVIQRANTDPAFRDRLLSDPAAACKEAGCAVPAGSVVEVIEQQPGEVHLFFGAKTDVPGLDALLANAEKDPALRQQLLTNPRTLVETAVGQKLPAGATVCVHERTPNRIRLFLSAPSSASGEMSDQELETVAGGGFFKNLFNRLCPDKIRRETDNVAGTFTEEVDPSRGGFGVTEVDIF